MVTIVKTILSLISLAVALIPVWFFLFIKHLLDPTGFWQNLVIYGLGWYFLAGFQILFFVVWVIVFVAIWANKKIEL